MPTELCVSTKTKLSCLNMPIDLAKCSKEIPVAYHLPMPGVVKKEMKFNSQTQEELDAIQALIPWLESCLNMC